MSRGRTDAAPAPAEPKTVAACVREMRRAAARGEPVDAAVIGIWAETFMAELYGKQKPVRFEVRPKGVVNGWGNPGEGDVTYASRRRLDVRALYLHPPPTKPVKEHRWDDKNVCRDCQEPMFLSGPDCVPPSKVINFRDRDAISLEWFRQPLEELIQLAKTARINRFDAAKLTNEANYLIERIDQHQKGKSNEP